MGPWPDFLWIRRWRLSYIHPHLHPVPGHCFIDNDSDRTKGPLFQTSVRNFRYRFLPQSYFLYVIVHVNSDTANDAIVDVVMVTVVTGKRPVVTISCIANCADHLNPLLPLALAADCSNCDPMENLSYVWTIHPAAHNNTIMDFDWKTNSVSGNKNRQILLKTGAFLDVDKNETYILTVIGNCRIHHDFRMSIIAPKKSRVYVVGTSQ